MDNKQTRSVQIEHIVNYLPKSVDLLPAVPFEFKPGPGLIGFADLVYVCINMQIAKPALRADLKAHSQSFTKDDLRLISGAALQHYWAFANQPSTRPTANTDPTLPSTPFKWVHEGAYFNTFGGPQSLGYYTGWSIRETFRLPENDYIAKLTYELACGRPVITTIKHEQMWQPALVTGYERHDNSFSFRVSTRKGTNSETLGHPDQPVVAHILRSFNNSSASTQSFRLAQEGPLHNYILEVLPPTSKSAAAIPQHEQLDVLIKWAIKHANTRQTFFPETWHTYHSGHSAWKALEELQVNDDDCAADDPSLLDHLHMLVLGRQSASISLEKWANLFEEMGERPKAIKALNVISNIFSEVAQALIEHDYSTAAQLEVSAFQSLKAIVT